MESILTNPNQSLLRNRAVAELAEKQLTANLVDEVSDAMATKKIVRITTVPLSMDKLLGKQLSYMNDFYEVTAVSSGKNELKMVADKYGVKHHHIKMTRSITPFQDLISLIKLIFFLIKIKPEVVHTHTPKAGLLGMMAAFFAGVPVRMHTVAGLPLLEARGFKRKILNFTERVTYFFSTNIYPNSFNLGKIIEDKNFCKKDKMKVLGNGSSNGIDSDYFSKENFSNTQISSLKKFLKISEDDFVFVFVGRLVKDKGINELVSAFTRLQQENTHKKNIKLLLVGPLEQELNPLKHSTLKKIEDDKNIIFMGFQEDVRPFLSISDCLVFPSYREGFPNVVLQAASMELPCIVSNINGCNEIIQNHENGIIIPAKHEKAIENAMMKVIDNREYYQHLKANSRKSIIEKYSQTMLWTALKEEYDLLLDVK